MVLQQFAHAAQCEALRRFIRTAVLGTLGQRFDVGLMKNSRSKQYGIGGKKTFLVLADLPDLALVQSRLFLGGGEADGVVLGGNPRGRVPGGCR